MSETHPPSPCTGVCEIDRATKACRGCLRTLDEITAWFTATPAQKHEILRAITSRQSVSVRST